MSPSPWQPWLVTRRGPSPARRRFRPQFDELEPRWTPAIITVTTLNEGAGTFTGGANPTDTTLRGAIANAASGDTIVFSAGLSGVIPLTIVGDTSVGPSAFAINKALTINGDYVGGNAGGVTISGGGTMRLFTVQSGGSLTLQYLTLSGGLAQGGDGGSGANGNSLASIPANAGGGGAAGLGGAIYVAPGATLNVQFSTLSGNRAQGGDGGNAGALTGGSGGGAGGGGGLGGAGSSYSGAKGGAGGGPNGGGGGNAGVNGSTGSLGGGGGGGGSGITDGGSGGFGGGGGGGTFGGGFGGFGGGGGGGGYGISGGAGGYGGGYGGGAAGPAFGGGGGGAGLGGAIFNNGGSVTLTNSTLSGNAAVGGSPGGGAGFATGGKGFGGAVFNRDGTLTVLNSTISGNTAADGGRGVFNLGDSLHAGGDSVAGKTATATINNTIIGQSDTAVSDFQGATNGTGVNSTSGVGNLIRVAVGFSGTVASTADPQLGGPAANGGPTLTLLPGGTSPVIDAGNDAAAAALTSDQRTFTPRISGTHVDIGAVEVGAASSAPVITSANSATFTAGAAGTFTVTATGSAPIILSETGTLPAGVTFNPATGLLSGTPGAGTVGLYPIMFTARNQGGPTTQAFALNVVSPPVLSTLTATQWTVNRPGFPGTIAISSGTGSFTVSSQTGLPPGLSAVVSGTNVAFVGTPTAAGTFAGVQITVRDSTGATVGGTYTITINPAPAFAPAVLPGGAAGTPYSQVLVVNGGTRPLTTVAVTAFSSGGTGLAAPAVNASAGVVTVAGTPTAAGTAAFTLVVTDAAGASVAQSCTITVSGPVAPVAPVIAVGTDAGLPATVNVYDARTMALKAAFTPFGPTFTGGVRVAVGDVTGDGVPDIIVGAGPGGGPEAKVYDGVSFQVVRDFYTLPASFTGGIFVAAGDVNGDGKADILVGADKGGGPQVQVYDGASGMLLQNFFAFAPFFKGGVRVAAGDVNGDGKADIICSAGPGGGPQVIIFDGTTRAVLANFFALPSFFTGGVYVAAGDVNSDGRADVITGAGAGGGPQVSIFDGRRSSLLSSFFALPAFFTGGVRVGALDLTGQGRATVLTAAGPGGGPQVSGFDSTTLALLGSFFAYSPAVSSGLFVGAR